MSISEQESESGRLSVTAPGARIRVLDAFRRPVEGATGEDSLTAELAPGAYRVTARIGAREVSRAVLVRASGPPSDIWLEPDFDAAAPVHSTATANETHAELASQLTSIAPPTAGRLVVILRGLRNRSMAELPAAGVAPAPTVTDQFGNVLPLPVPAEDPHHVHHPGGGNRALGWAIDVAPGGYRVRWAAPDADAQIEHALWVAPQSQTVLFVPQGPAGPVAAGASVHVVPTALPWDAYAPGTIAVETTLAVLRSASTRERVEVWRGVLADHNAPPMLGLLTLHEMVRSVGADLPADLRPDAERLLQQLRGTLGENPDVLSLIATLDPSLVSGEVFWPPMLHASHDLLLAGERSGHDLIAAGSLIERATGQMYATAPWHLYDPTGLDGPDATTPAAPPSYAPSAPPAASPPAYSDRWEAGAAGGPFTSDSSWSDEAVGHVGGAEAAESEESEQDVPPPVAMERVKDLLGMVESAPGGGAPPDPDEVADRLGMTSRLARSCMDRLQG